MGVVESLFGMPLERLPLDRLVAFLQSESVETDAFESKSVPDDRFRGGDYAEDAAAFLNTNGGLLLIGGPRLSWIDPGRRPLGKRFDGAPSGHPRIARDSLRDAVLGRIEPLPAGVRFQTWELSPGRDLTAVEIPKSLYPPHQVAGRYFIRLDGTTRPAPHGFVEALFRRRQSPHLILRWGELRSGIGDRITLAFKLANQGTASALHGVLRIFLPARGITATHSPPYLRETEDGVVFVYPLEAERLHPQEDTDFALELRGLNPEGMHFEVAIFAQNAVARYEAYRFTRPSLDPATKRITRRVERVEDGFIDPDRLGFPYSSLLISRQRA